MLLDRETWTSAQAMIRHYGHDARAQAGMRAAGFAAEGDPQGQREWIRIIQAISWLQDDRPGSALQN
jgi:hypothetical protein